MTNWLDEIRWATVCPHYSLVRLAFGTHSRAEARFHAQRRVSSIASACRAGSQSVQTFLTEADRSKTIADLSSTVESLPWQGTFRAARELYAIVRLLRPTRVVETGVGAGYSSTHILAALEANGEGSLCSIDLPNNDVSWRLPEGYAPGYLVPHPLRSRWSLRIGDSRNLLPRVLDELEHVDMFLHDSEHTYETMSFEFACVFPRLARKGLLISDDAFWNTAVLDARKRFNAELGLIYHRGGSTPVAYLKHSEFG